MYGDQDLVLKLVKCHRIANNVTASVPSCLRFQVPTEAENLAKVFSDHPSIGPELQDKWFYADIEEAWCIFYMIYVHVTLCNSFQVEELLKGNSNCYSLCVKIFGCKAPTRPWPSR